MQNAGPRIQATECQVLTVPPSVKYGKENIWSINAIVSVPLNISKKVIVNPSNSSSCNNNSLALEKMVFRIV